MHAYNNVSVHVYEHLAACTCVCMRAYMCVYACSYVHFAIPLSIRVGLAGFAPSPPPPILKSFLRVCNIAICSEHVQRLIWV